MLLGCVLTSFLYMQLSNYPNLLKSLFSHCIFLPPLLKIDYECVGLFLGSLFCPVHQSICLFGAQN